MIKVQRTKAKRAIKYTGRKYPNKELNNRHIQNKKPIKIRKGKGVSRNFAG